MSVKRTILWAVAWKDDGKVLIYGAQQPVAFFTREEAYRWRRNSTYRTCKVVRYQVSRIGPRSKQKRGGKRK